MDSLILIALLILCWILFVTVVSIMALIRFKEYKQEIFMLKREVFLLRDRINAAPVPQQEEGVKESAPAIVEPLSEPELQQEPKPEPVTVSTPPLSELHRKVGYEEEPEIKTLPQDTEPAQPEERPSRTVDALMGFLRGGNIWVAGGVVFLVLGVAFAYTYIASVYHIPDEFKIGMGFLIGFALFALGWRQRVKRRSFAMVVQGGGIGILYLSLFASAKIYDIFPVGLVFLLMIVLIALAVIISVYQSSEVLALFAVVIGYCVPLLLSTGSGNYIVLFSYYILIGLAVLAIAVKKYWRYLNSTSFIFTFAVGIVWGMSRYRHEQFWSIEFFLVAFFLIFTAINILATLRQKSKLIENAYAMTLSFTYITLQMVLTEPFRYGQSIASVTLGAFYILLSFGLVKYLKDRLNQLVTLYLGLGIVFINFAIPFALEGDWTAGIWAVEGAALVILGVYQRNKIFRWFGSALTVLALCAAAQVYEGYNTRPFLSSAWAVRILSAVSLVTAACAYHKQHLHLDGVKRKGESYSRGYLFESSILSHALLMLGAVSWYVIFMTELERLSSWGYGLSFLMLALMLLSISAFIFNLLASKLEWPILNVTLTFPFLLIFMGIFSQGSFYPPFFIATLPTVLGWLPFFALAAFLVYRYICPKESEFSSIPHWKKVQAVFSVILIFIVTIFVSANIARFTTALQAYSLVAVLVTVLCMWFMTTGYLVKLPLLDNKHNRFWSAMVLGVYVLLLVMTYSRIPVLDGFLKLPLFNTVDITSVIAILGSIYVLIYYKYKETGYLSRSIFNVALALVAIVTFIWLHCALGRGVALVTDIPYRAYYLFDSAAYQLSIAILWGVTGFGAMLFGMKVARRAPWLAGAILLACDSLKLLVIDLSNVGTLPRIGSFMAVGLIFIVIGYFVPLPPKRTVQEEEKNEEI